MRILRSRQEETGGAAATGARGGDIPLHRVPAIAAEDQLRRETAEAECTGPLMQAMLPRQDVVDHEASRRCRRRSRQAGLTRWHGSEISLEMFLRKGKTPTNIAVRSLCCYSAGSAGVPRRLRQNLRQVMFLYATARAQRRTQVSFMCCIGSEPDERRAGRRRDLGRHHRDGVESEPGHLRGALHNVSVKSLCS